LAYAKNKAKLPNFSYKGPEETISERAIKKISKGNPAKQITFPVGIAFEGTDAVFEGEFGDSEVVRVVGGKMIFKNGKLAQPVTLEAGWAMRDQILSWIEGKETYDSKGQKVLRFFFDSKGRLQYEKKRGFVNPPTVIRDVASTRKGSEEIEGLFGQRIMDFPKPVDLMKYLAELITDDNDTVMDFFAGSCGTAQAVLELNRVDGRHRRFIMVQLQEPTSKESAARNAGYETISSIGKERIRRVIKRLKEANQESLTENGPEDLGFKVFRLSESNYKPWKGVEEKTPDKYAAEMEAHIDSLVEGWKKENVIYEVTVKEGLGLTSRIERETAYHDNEIWRVTDKDKQQSFLICLDDKVKPSSIKELKLAEDDVFICRDIAIDDTGAANLALQCKLKTI
jgi:adenine-specific DNA-methyltransferase